MHYLDGIETDPPIEPDNALILGTAVHIGIEQGVDKAIEYYTSSYPIMTDEHYNEIIKLESVIPKVIIPEGGVFEEEIITEDFKGFIDYIVSVNDDKQDIYDFKYTANPYRYRDSPQLSLYKYFYERMTGEKIRNLYYLIVPKVSIKQGKNETLSEFRKRLKKKLEKAEVKKIETEFNINHVIDFLLNIKRANEEVEFAPDRTILCRWCEFEDYCEKGWDYFMKLPENKRRNIEAESKRKLWIYGAPFSGKTTFASSFPDPLIINTDGNIKYVDAPYIHIKDEVKVEGRITKRDMAWEMFKDVVVELEKKENTFNTIVVDLVEDLYEHCRLYMYKKLDITHESDDSFRSWDKVRGEFLNTLKRLMNLDYENIILISHEDMTKDITRKTGDKITAIKPNLQDKVALKVAGMVDVVARVVADDNEHKLCFKSNEVVFGGGRLKVDIKEIALNVDELFNVYDEANKNALGFVPGETEAKSSRRGRVERVDSEGTAEPVEALEDDEPIDDSSDEETESEGAVEASEDDSENVASAIIKNDEEEAKVEEKPRRRRKVRE